MLAKRTRLRSIIVRWSQLPFLKLLSYMTLHDKLFTETCVFFTFAVFGLSRFHREKWRVSPSENEVWLGAESNRRHEDFQSSALPTELPSRIVLPLSRCIERRVLIKAENARPSTPSCSSGLQALVECCHRSVARQRLGLPLWGKHSCLLFLCRRRERLPYKVSAHRAQSNKRVTLCGSTKSRPPREVFTGSCASN